MFVDALHSFRTLVNVACAFLLAIMYLFVFADYMQSAGTSQKIEVSAGQPSNTASGPGVFIIEEVPTVVAVR
ncbi:MAG: hypothetical protein JWP13_689 [Candidatus Saccharibacteria bacterium]|nr:hypothetical protein [Candidatus Saccharibacteria bacterium]